MALATAPAQPFDEPVLAQISRGQALWTVIKRKPLGMWAAGVALRAKTIQSAPIMVKASSSQTAAWRSSASFWASLNRGTPGSFWAASTKVREYWVVNFPSRQAKSGMHLLLNDASENILRFYKARSEAATAAAAG